MGGGYRDQSEVHASWSETSYIKKERKKENPINLFCLDPMNGQQPQLKGVNTRSGGRARGGR